MIAPVGADDHIGPPNTLSRGEGVSEADGSGMRAKNQRLPFVSVPAPVLHFGSLPGAVLSVSAQKVPKEAAWRGVELIAPAIKATPPRPPQARTVVFAVLHSLLLEGL